jgi:hypothetical protein
VSDGIGLAEVLLGLPGFPEIGQLRQLRLLGWPVAARAPKCRSGARNPTKGGRAKLLT